MSERTLHKKSAPEGRASNIELLRMLAGMAVVIPVHPAAMVTGRHPAAALGLRLCTVAGIYLVSFDIMLLWNGAERLLLKTPLGNLPDVSVESPGRGNGGRP